MTLPIVLLEQTQFVLMMIRQADLTTAHVLTRNVRNMLENLIGLIEPDPAIKMACERVAAAAMNLSDELAESFRGSSNASALRQTAEDAVAALDRQLASARPNQKALALGYSW